LAGRKAWTIESLDMMAGATNNESQDAMAWTNGTRDTMIEPSGGAGPQRAERSRRKCPGQDRDGIPWNARRRWIAHSGCVEDAGVTELVTPRLLLRDFRLSDEAAVHGYASDPTVTVFTGWGPNDEAATREFIVQAAAEPDSAVRRTYTLAAALRTTDEVIGSAGLVVEDLDTKSGSIGYVIHPAFWGRGYATEAAERLLQFGFTDLRLHRIWATCRPDNRASARVLEKVGMQLEGQLRDHILIRGERRDSLLYAASKPS
jgi:[ribosomal protein S5]-alanine N-acetyltransferase